MAKRWETSQTNCSQRVSSRLFDLRWACCHPLWLSVSDPGRSHGDSLQSWVVRPFWSSASEPMPQLVGVRATHMAIWPPSRRGQCHQLKRAESTSSKPLTTSASLAKAARSSDTPRRPTYFLPRPPISLRTLSWEAWLLSSATTSRRSSDTSTQEPDSLRWASPPQPPVRPSERSVYPQTELQPSTPIHA
jgi:hypothetical protein